MTASSAPLKILLVEDSKLDAILIEKALTQGIEGECQLQTAETLRVALEQLSEHAFDVVLLDLSLPDTAEFNGLLSIQNMAPQLPIVILTAYTDEEMALSAVAHGAQDYLFKNKVAGTEIRRAIRYAMRRKQFEETLITRANFDLLTGLANRSLFESRLDIALARRLRSGEGVGVFFLDLDRFKQVNDQHGHGAGDQLLQEVARRLQQSIRPYDTAARFGGDEFALIIDGVKQVDDCVMIADKIIQRIAQPFNIFGKTLNVGVSIGIAACLAETNDSRKDLTRCADEAMYVAKQEPQSAYKIYSPAIHEQALLRSKSV